MDSLDFFRKNLKPIMAALTLMAMITFVFDDSMRAGNTTLVPFILAILFGGGGFVWGTRKGKQNEYLAMGALAGAVLGLTVMVFGERDVDASVTIAGLTPREISNLKSRRETANRIVTSIFRKSHPVPEQFAKDERMRQFYEAQILGPQMQQIQFTFGNDDFEKDVIFGDLLHREAVRLGISVNDEAVSDFIKMISDQKLTTKDFRELKQELHAGDHYIYDLLRDEIAARMAAEMTFPRAVATPQQRWQDFRKINVKHSIEATTIPVEAFVKNIPDPTDSELLAFFHKHSEKFPSAKGEPGFRQPARVRLAYLEADFETIESKVTPPTDEEVAKYYEDNKEFFIDRTPAKTEKKSDGTEGDDPKKPEGDDAKKPDDKPDSEKSDKPEVKKDEPKKEGDKPQDPPVDKPKPGKPAEPEKSEKPKDDKPTAEPKKESEKKSDSEGTACDDKVAETKKPDEPKSKQDQPKTEGEESEKKDAAKSEAEKPEKKVDPKAEEKPPEEKPKAESNESKDDKPATEKDKKDDSAKSDAETEADKKPELKYKPFEDVKDKIQEDLLRDRTLDEMKLRITSVVAKMRRLGSYTIAEKTSKSYKSPESIAVELKDIAESLDMKYVQTSWLSAEELSKSEKFTIGSATDPLDDVMSRQGSASVIQRVFDRGNDSTHTPEVAEDPGTKNRFAYWVVERREAHVPKFEDEGIREQATKAWKLTQAGPKADARAKAIAKLAEGKKLTEVLASETVTGDKDGQTLTVIEPTAKFSHFTMSGMSAPGVNPFQGGNERVQLTQIPGLDKLGDDFFTAVDNLKQGETAAIPNFDRSAFVVVHVTEREEIATEDDAPQRGDFMKTWPSSPPANELASASFYPLRREWMESIERKYNVKWPVK